jgi:hypothetical protein
MHDHPFAQTVFADFDRYHAAAAHRSVCGVPVEADVTTAIKRAAQENDVPADTVRRWLKEAGKL